MTSKRQAVLTVDDLEQLNQLEEVAPDLVSDSPAVVPAMIGIDGALTRMVTCCTHRQSYPQLWIKSLELWSGTCLECAHDEKIEMKARQELSSEACQKELRTRFQERLAEQDASIAGRAQEWIVWHVENELRASVEASLRSELAGKIKSEIEGEMLAERVAELRAAEEDSCLTTSN
jgi:hypothetical protein